MRRYLTLIVVPFVLASVISAQTPKPSDPPKDPPAAKAPTDAPPPVPKQVTPPGKTVVAPPVPVDTRPDVNKSSVKPSDCPAGQTCVDTKTPPIAAPMAHTPHMSQYLLSSDMNFVGRVEMAAMTIVNEVLAEPETTANHDARMKFVGHIMREPDFAARKIARLVAIGLPIDVDKSSGFASTPATDTQIVTFLRQRWTALSMSMGQLF